jgi:hypothetical protein
MNRLAVYQPSPTQSPAVFDSVITWGDATTEHVRITKDGWILIDGVRRRYVGFEMYYRQLNLAKTQNAIDHMVAYGCRVIQLNLGYEGNDNPATLEDMYDDVLDYCYDNKLLVFPRFSYKNQVPFDNLATIDFDLDVGASTDLVSTAVARWVNKVKSYSNVVAIFMENEMEYHATAVITPTLVTSYLTTLKGVIRPLTTLPIICKMSIYGTDATVIGRREAIFPFTDIPAFQPYGASVAEMTVQGNNFDTACKRHGFGTTQKWATEVNYTAGASASLTKVMVDAVLAYSSLVFLFTMYWAGDGVYEFFDANGDPLALTDTLLSVANMATWQAPC